MDEIHLWNLSFPKLRRSNVSKKNLASQKLNIALDNHYSSVFVYTDQYEPLFIITIFEGVIALSNTISGYFYSKYEK